MTPETKAYEKKERNALDIATDLILTAAQNTSGNP